MCVYARTRFAYHRVNGLPFPFLQGFPGLLSAPNPLRAQAQQPTHVGPEEASVAIVDRSIIGQDLHPRNLIALGRRGEKRRREMVNSLSSGAELMA